MFINTPVWILQYFNVFIVWKVALVVCTAGCLSYWNRPKNFEVMQTLV